MDRQLKASVVTGDSVRLVPYCRAHVPWVHKWKQDLEPHSTLNPSLNTLQDLELLRLLGSEPGTSDDEVLRARVKCVSGSGLVGRG